MFLQVTQDDNPELGSLLDLFTKIPHKGDKINVDPGVVSLKSLLPSKVSLTLECSLQPCDEIEFVFSVEDMQNYYTYDGSLTTPMCYESVRWIVFREKMGLSRLQVRNILIRLGRSLMSTLVSSSINYVN